MIIVGDVIHHHEEKIRRGVYVRVENFGVKRKHARGFQKGDMPWTLLVTQNSHISVLPSFSLEWLPIFYTETCIKDFKKKTHKMFPMASFSIVVVDVRGLYKGENNEDFNQIMIADAIIKDDHDIIGFSHSFHDEYLKIKAAFESGEQVLVMFKNISTTLKYDRFLKTNAFSIVTPVVDEKECAKLLLIYSRISTSNQADLKEVTFIYIIF